MVEQAGLYNRQMLLNKLVDYAKDRLSKQQRSQKENELITHFIRLYYANVASEDLVQRRISDLYGAAVSHWDFMHNRKPGQFKVRIFNPSYEETGWESTHTIVEVVADDMPFMVDSLRMELNRFGFNIHLVIHLGGMKVHRDRKGQLQDLLPYESKDDQICQEAPLYFEIDHQDDEKQLEKLRKALIKVMDDIRAAYQDWTKMREKLKHAGERIAGKTGFLDREELQESCAFIKWALNDNFTFLGMRKYKVEGEGQHKRLNLEPESSMGILKERQERSINTRYFADLPTAGRYEALSKSPLLLSKSTLRSTVHRPAYCDCITVKEFDDNGFIVEQYHFLGLFTSSAYNMSIKEIPILRQKVNRILGKSKMPPSGHAAKKLIYILETLPRDDVFQAPWDELYELAMGILQLQERQKIRLFVRKDAFGRYVSCFVYVPRDNFSTNLLNRMRKIMSQAFDAQEISVMTYFSESVLARIHFFIRVDPEKPLDFDIDAIEKQIADIARSWQDELYDELVEHFGEQHGISLYNRYYDAFPAGYREYFNARTAVFDIAHMEKLSAECSVDMSFYRPVGAPEYSLRLKLYSYKKGAQLSDTLPILENMGLHVIDERPYEVRSQSGECVYIHDYNMAYLRQQSFNIEHIKDIFHEAFLHIWFNRCENDGFNQLVISALLNWHEIAMLRAYARYFRQIGFTFSHYYIEQTLAANPKVVRALVDLFYARFDPTISSKERNSKEQKLRRQILNNLDKVSNLDDDRILRHYLNTIRATLRTNFFQKQQDRDYKDYISLKLEPKRVPDVPLPVPMYEVFVYSPRFEGVHLRMDKVARGGVRWSDRREDFRREVLDLMKAQQVKNAAIVPEGAKGGFVPKKLPDTQHREAVYKEAITCYQYFIRGLLDITDNLSGSEVVPPPNTVRYDGNDYYLVVAADKGTATFSDYANNISQNYGFWLDDAFASGGSTGFDHKKLGITARAAWESVKYHFQELGRHPQKEPITVVGIGDMAGDVFGNGMLLSRQIKLVAAFNHRHIFIDPDPDPEASYDERKRLFKMSRSSWADYHKDLISKGGGVFERSAKSVSVSDEMKELLDIKQDQVEPAELIRAVLKARVDLLWNGGIGTYVKASSERNSEIGDRSNNAVRINGNQLNCQVVGEGGNLGFTQLARIEYELNGGRINTDFVDNSGAVDCSDHEVNIKILLNQIEANGDITRKQRNDLLYEMDEEVARLVLENNYQQVRAISLARKQSPDYLDLYQRFMDVYEREGRLNRSLEFLPDDDTLEQRKAEQNGLTRPELAVLFAYNKIILKEELLKSSLPDNDSFVEFLESTMPESIQHNYKDEIKRHRLRREIIATQLSNRVVTDMGPTFVYQIRDEIGASTSKIAQAFVIASKIFKMSELLGQIAELDHEVDYNVQVNMRQILIRLVRRTTRWILHNLTLDNSIQPKVDHFREKIEAIESNLPKLMGSEEKRFYQQSRRKLKQAGVPDELATKMANTNALYGMLNVIAAADETGADITKAAKCYYAVLQRLHLVWFRRQIDAYPVYNRWTVLARAGYKADLDWKQKALTIGILTMEEQDKSIKQRLDAWHDKYQWLIRRWETMLQDIQRAKPVEFPMLAVAMQELRELAQSCLHESSTQTEEALMGVSERE